MLHAPQLCAHDVGPQAMPREISPIKAPFAMPQLKRPDFGERRVTAQFTLDSPESLVTAQLQSAIDQLCDAGGGTLTLPRGEWLTGRIVLKSGVNLCVPEGATLRFSGQIEDYLPALFTRQEGMEITALGGLIYAHNAKRIGVTGGGRLVGPDEGPLREARPGLLDDLVDLKLPVAERLFDGQQGRHYLRPQFINLIECRDVLIEGVSLEHGPMWNVVPIYCDRVIVRGVTVESRGVVNGDGVNIVSSRNVLVEYCSMNTGDDCYAIKAGRGADGVRAARPVEKVVLRYNHAAGGFGGITCGSETGGGIRDIYAHDCEFEDVLHAVYLKTRRPRGTGGERITVERIRFTAYNHGLFFDMIGSPMYVGELGYRLPRRELTPLTPYYRDVKLRDIHGECSTGDAFKIKGIPESPASHVQLERVDITAPGLPNLTDVADLEVKDSTFTASQPALLLVDVNRAAFDNCTFRVEDDDAPVIDVSGGETAGIVFRGSQPLVPEDHIHAHDGAKRKVVRQLPSHEADNP